MPRNEFMEMLRRGRLIDLVTVQGGGPDTDDDRVALYFGPPDPAVSSFRVPIAPKGGGEPA
jgi:hypothetical protein